MIQVLAGEDNDFGTNSGCKMHVFVQLHTVNVLGKSFKITITIDRDQAWDVEAQCKTTLGNSNNDKGKSHRDRINATEIA